MGEPGEAVWIVHHAVHHLPVRVAEVTLLVLAVLLLALHGGVVLVVRLRLDVLAAAGVVVVAQGRVLVHVVHALVLQQPLAVLMLAALVPRVRLAVHGVHGRINAEINKNINYKMTQENLI